MSRGGGSSRQPRRIEPCQCVGGQPWAGNGPLKVQMQPLQRASGVVKSVLGAEAGLGSLFWGVAFLPVACGDFQRRRQHSATTAHRALPVCERPALGMPWGTARSNATSAVCSRCGGACTGCCGRAGQMVCGGCGFATFRSFSVEEAQLGNHRAQSPASVCVINPDLPIGRCNNIKYSLCGVQQVQWSLHWMLRQG